MKKYILPIFACAMLIACGNPFKVTDPSDPRFDPDKFSFRDYSYEELRAAYRVLFPPGTSREFVERVLVEAGGVERYGCAKLYAMCSYYYPNYMQDSKRGAKYKVLYDKNNKVIVAGGHPQFREISTKYRNKANDEFRKQKGISE